MIEQGFGVALVGGLPVVSALAASLVTALLKQTAWLSMLAALLLLVRRPLARYLGHDVAYASWLLLPLLLLTLWLPTAPSAVVVMSTLGADRLPPLATAVTARPASALAGLALAVWGLGALAVALRMIVAQRRIIRSLVSSADGDHWTGAAGPALVGLWPARLVLPHDFHQRFDIRQRALVLAHEAVHRRRFDNHWNALAAALCVVHWFNPLAWLALRAMRTDQELACDAAVMRAHPGSAATYGQALLQAQQQGSPLFQPWSGWRSAHPLLERIRMLSQAPRSPWRRRAGAALLAVTALGTAGVMNAVQAMQAPEGGSYVDLQLQLAVTGPAGASTDTRRAKARLIIEEGKTGVMVMGGSPAHPMPDQIRLEVQAKHDAGGLLLAFVARQGDQVLSKPRLLVKDGEQARLKISGDAPGQPNLDIQLTAHATTDAQPR